LSLHPSLKIDTAGAQQRTVLSRLERIKELMKKGIWVENQVVTGLPKTKILKIKAKKKVKEVAADAAGTDAAAAPAAGAKDAKPAKADAKPAKADAKPAKADAKSK